MSCNLYKEFYVVTHPVKPIEIAKIALGSSRAGSYDVIRALVAEARAAFANLKDDEITVISKPQQPARIEFTATPDAARAAARARNFREKEAIP